MRHYYKITVHGDGDIRWTDDSLSPEEEVMYFKEFDLKLMLAKLDKFHPVLRSPGDEHKLQAMSKALLSLEQHLRGIGKRRPPLFAYDSSQSFGGNQYASFEAVWVPSEEDFETIGEEK